MNVNFLLLVFCVGGYVRAATMRVYNNTDYLVTVTVSMADNSRTENFDLKPRDHHFIDSGFSNINWVEFTPHNPFPRPYKNYAPAIDSNSSKVPYDQSLYNNFNNKYRISSVKVKSNITTLEIRVAYDGEAHLEKGGTF